MQILNEISALIERLSAEIDAGTEEHDIGKMVDLAGGSVINQLFFGHGYDVSTEGEYQSLKAALNDFHDAMADPRLSLFYGKSMLLNIMPPSLADVMDRITKSNKTFADTLKKQIEAHRADVEADGPNVHDPPRDYLTAFLREKARRDAAGEKHSYIFEQLKSECYELWFAGADDPQNVFGWGMAYALNLPEGELQPIYDELDAVIGSERLVTLADRQSLPVLGSFMMETLRLANAVSQNLPHRATRDVVVDGYTLKKDTVVIPQLSTVLLDPNVRVLNFYSLDI